MKAKDYFAKYEKEFFDISRRLDEVEMSIRNLLVEFAEECYQQGTKRKCLYPEAWRGQIQEFDLKWKSLYSLFVKKYGCCPFSDMLFSFYLTGRTNSFSTEENFSAKFLAAYACN